MENRKNTILLTVIAVATLLVAVVGATFAYFTAQGGDDVTKNINVTTDTTDSATFSLEPITITATQENFGQGDGDQTATSTGTASFTANSTDESTEFCYTLTINVASNDFEYTTAPANTPELVLDVTKDAGTKSSPVSVITAKDVTTQSAGAIQVPTTNGGSDYIHKITAGKGATVVDTFKITLAFKNLDSDQNKNQGKTFTGNMVFAKAECA